MIKDISYFTNLIRRRLNESCLWDKLIQIESINSSCFQEAHKRFLYSNYSVKVIANVNLVQEMICGYDSEWDISRTSERKDPLILFATGVMKQQPTVRAFLGRVVEEKFHMQALALTIIPGISLVPERLKDLVHPQVAPLQLNEGVKEGYFYVNLSMNQDFSNGPEFYENTTNREELGKIKFIY